MPMPRGSPAKLMVVQLSRDLRDTSTSNRQSGEPRWLLAGVSLGGTDAGAQVPTNFATRVTGRDVVEISMVLDGTEQLVVHHGELRQGRLLSAAGRVHDTIKGRRRPTSPSDRTPASIEVNGSATKVGSDIRIAAMVSYRSEEHTSELQSRQYL